MHYSERSDHMVLIGSVLAPCDKNVRITNGISSVSVLHFCSYPPSHLVPQLGCREWLSSFYAQLVNLCRKLNFLTSQSSAEFLISLADRVRAI